MTPLATASDRGSTGGRPDAALGRCRYVGARVKQLINNAYGVFPLDRIVGGPSWIDSTAAGQRRLAADKAEWERMVSIMDALFHERG